MGAKQRNRSHHLIASILLTLPGTAEAQSADAALSNARRLLSVSECGGERAPDEVVVCGRANEDRRFRLPLPAERLDLVGGPVAGEAVRPGVALDGSAAPCGIFAGQRRCGKAEALAYGYGGGRDPLTVGANLLGKLIDGDAEIGSPDPYPRP